jgi:hypothetical protein
MLVCNCEVEREDIGSTLSMTLASFPLLLLKIFGFKVLKVGEERII